ncbi:MAG: T9SS type A sorting domain-containing protein, partial [Bacteroidota bacterium]
EKGETNGTPPASISIDIDQSDVGIQLVTVWAGDQAGNWDYCETTLIINNFSTQFITGKVYQELNGNCQRDENELGLPSKTVMARSKNSQKTYTSFTDSFGNYTIPVNGNAEAEEYEIKVISDLDYSQNCPAIYTLNQLKEGDNTQDIPFVINADCNEVLGVNIGTPTLEICADNTYYVNYCNFGAEAAEVAIIEVQLDPFLEIRSASIPYTTGENNTIIFFLENLAPAKCDTSFSFTAFLSCDAVKGQTHLVDATIFSDQPCENDNPSWSGASIKVTGECEDDQIKMNIQNIGTGDMLAPLEYVIVEDVLLLRSEKFKLNQGQGINFNFAANGSTWRLEAEQEGNHPGQSMPSVTVEGCGGINTTGLVGLFPQDDADLNRAIDYQQNTNEPMAPNSLRAFPEGYGAAHFIEQNVPIQYVVDFLPEVDSEATTATIEMKLSPYLDINSIQTGVSNLSYTFEKTETSIRFLFNDISPLSAEQRGFIKFKISQKTDNPRNSLIENQAAISFDENTPTMTRVVFHTVDADHLELTASTSVVDEAGGHLTVYPNPTTDRLQVQLADYSLTQGRFNLLTVSGQLLQSHVFQDNQLTIEELNLAAGLYFYQIESEGKPVHYGKLVVR